MTAGATTRGSRAFVAAGVVWFVAFNAAVPAGAGAGSIVTPAGLRTARSGLVLVGSLGYAWIFLTISEERR